MIQSVSESYYSYLSSVSSTTNTAKTAATNTDENSVSDLSQKIDSVEISDQAGAAMQQQAVAASAGTKTSVQTKENSEQSMDTSVQEKAQEKILKSESNEVTATASSSNDFSTTDLSTYTETQLDKLVSQGKITKAEENSELHKRAAVKSQQQNTAKQSNSAASRYNGQAQTVQNAADEVGTTLDIVA